MNLYEIVANNIKQAMKDRSIGLEELSKATGISLNTLSKIINCKLKRFNLSKLALICDALDVKSDYILGLTDKK